MTLALVDGEITGAAWLGVLGALIAAAAAAMSSADLPERAVSP